MCVIIDADLAGDVFKDAPAPDYRPILRWLLRGNGTLVFGGRNARELYRIGRAARMIQVLRSAGKAFQQPDEQVDARETTVTRTGLCRSNDPHIIALAQISGARTLCSHDQDLHADFRNRELISNPRGMIYQGAAHKRPLKHTNSCPG